MKYLIAFVTALFIMGCSTSNDIKQEIENPKSDEEINLAINQSAVEIFKSSVKTESSDKNVIVSPISIQQAFGMAANGASNQTLDELATLFGTTAGQLKGINDRLLELQNLLITNESNNTIGMANGLFYDASKFKMNETYESALQNYFKPSFKTLDFKNESESVDAINNWAAEKTEQKITKILENIKQEEFMFLINALYLKSDWDLPFPVETTYDRDFTDSKGNVYKTPTMYERNYYEAYSSDQEDALKMTLGNGKIEALFILPKTSDLDQYIGTINHESLQKILDNVRQQDLMVSLPKYELKVHYDLKPILATYGVTTPFSQFANFENMGTADGRILLTRAMHDVYMKVDEKGIEGAAVTTVGVGTTSAPPFFEFNRPFLMVVKDKATGTYLFIGKIANPTLSS